MDNIYGANAAIAVSADGVEHAVWVQNGKLWHGTYDDDTNQWNKAKSITPISADNVELLTGRLIPYKDANGRTQYAPGLAAVWEYQNSLYAVIGKYNSQGKIEWSETLPITLPETDAQGNQINHQNLDIALTPQVISQGGREIPPGILVTFQKVASNDPQADTDIYSQVFNLQLKDNQLQLVTQGQNNQPITFQTQEPEAPTYQSLPPEVQGVSAAVATAESNINPSSPSPQQSQTFSGSDTIPLNRVKSFNVSLSNLLQSFALGTGQKGAFPGVIPDLYLRGSREGSKSYNYDTKKEEYTLTMNFMVGKGSEYGVGDSDDADTRKEIAKERREVNKLQKKVQDATGRKDIGVSIQSNFAFSLGLNLGFAEDSNNKNLVQYSGYDSGFGIQYSLNRSIGWDASLFASASASLNFPIIDLLISGVYENNQNKATLPPIYIAKNDKGEVVVVDTTTQNTPFLELLNSASNLSKSLSSIAVNRNDQKDVNEYFKVLSNTRKTPGFYALTYGASAAEILGSLGAGYLYSKGFFDTLSTVYGDKNYVNKGGGFKVGLGAGLA